MTLSQKIHAGQRGVLAIRKECSWKDFRQIFAHSRQSILSYVISEGAKRYEKDSASTLD